MTERLAACSACHGERGEGLQTTKYNPHLAGKPAQYVFDQLQAFRDGRRVYPQMTWLLRNMTDDYLRRIAAHYAAMPPRTRPADASPPVIDAAVEARVRELVHEGDPARGVPACSACHGASLTGLEPRVPALVGLPAEYVVAQMGAWRLGLRKAREPDCMAAVAKALDPADVRVMATWLAGQGHAEPMPPAAAGSFALPDVCGVAP